MIYPDSQLVLDPFQDDFIRNYYAACALMGIYGIDEIGATNTDMRMIQTERAMIEHSRELVILADRSKFGIRGSLKLCGFNQIHCIITDSGISEEQRQTVLSQGIQPIVV
ncbi:hypothetical protein ES703_83357 [subsurface metagenome]